MSRTKKEVFAKFEGAAHRRFETRALPSLQEQRNNLIAEMEGIISGAQAETRALTEEESGRFDVIKKEIAAIDKTLAAEAEARSLGEGNEERDHEDMEQRALDEANFVKYLRGETRALDVANNGAVIPQTIADRIIDKVKELSPIYARATVFNIGGDLIFPVYDDSSDTGAKFVEDMEELEESSGKFTSITLENYIIGALSVISKSLINRKGFDLAGYVILKVAQKIAELLEKTLLNGEPDKCQGVFNTENTITTEGASITADDLIDLQMEVPEVFQPNACWIMNKKTFKAIRKLKNDEGDYIFNKDLTSSFGWTLLGKPVDVSDNAPEAAKGKVAIVYGDMSGLYVKLTKEMELQVLLEKYATKHAIGVVGYTEFDSKIVEKQKIAGLKIKSTAGSN